MVKSYVQTLPIGKDISSSCYEIISGDPKKMDQKLEEQFDRGLEHKLKSGYKGHLGLGFQVFQTKFSSQDTTKLPLFTRLADHDEFL